MAPLAHEPESRAVVEILATVFGDTILDVAHLDQDADAYVIGEGPRARLTVGGEGLPEAAGFALVQPEQGATGRFWLSFTSSMRGSVGGESGRRTFAELVATSAQTQVIREGEHHRLLLEPGETAWIEYQSLRFRVRLVRQPPARLGLRPRDRGFVASLASSACLGLIFLALLRLQPQGPDFLDLEMPLEQLIHVLPEDPTEAELEFAVEASAVEPSDAAGPPMAADHRSPRPPREDRPNVAPARSQRGRLFWTAEAPAQAVGKYARSYDPVEAARHAGMLGMLGGRDFVGDPADAAFNDSIDDEHVWARTSEFTGPTLAFNSVGDRQGLAQNVIGLGHTGLLTSGEGTIGVGSYGHGHTWSEMFPDEALGSQCSGDCRRRSRRPHVTLHIGRLKVVGGIDSSFARRIVRAHRPELIRCFERSVQAPFTTRASAEISMTISQSKVRGAVVENPSLDNAALDRCLSETVRRWKFPNRGDRQTNIITLPMTFNR